MHIVKEKKRSQRGRLSLSSRNSGTAGIAERGEVRQCFLFSNTLIIATRYYNKRIQILLMEIHVSCKFPSVVISVIYLRRTADGKLHLLPEIGKIPFVDATLIEDPTETGSCEDDDGKFLFKFRIILLNLHTFMNEQ